MTGPANSINESTTGITGFTGTAFTGTPVTQHALQVGGATSSTLVSLSVATTGKILQGNTGADPSFSTATYPSVATGTGKVLIADGTNWVASTPTFPNASATTRKIIVSDGTNWVASTETYAVPGTSGNLLTSNGTNWTSAAPATNGTVTSVSGTTNQVSVATGTTTPVISLVGPYTPATYTAHGILVGEGTSSIVAMAAGSAGQIVQSGGAAADPVYSTSTYPATNAVSTLLYASAANVMSALATANTAILATNSSGVPSITTASGNWLNTSRCAFYVYLNATTGGVVGNSTTPYNVLFDTKAFDQGTDYNTGTSTFTAPVTGKYFFTGCARIGAITAAMTNGDIRFVASAKTFVCSEYNIGAGKTVAATAGFATLVGDFIINMTAADTCILSVYVNGGASAAATIQGSQTGGSYLSGFLIC